MIHLMGIKIKLRNLMVEIVKSEIINQLNKSEIIELFDSKLKESLNI